MMDCCVRRREIEGEVRGEWRKDKRKRAKWTDERRGDKGKCKREGGE